MTNAHPLSEHARKCEVAGEVLRSSGTLRLRVTGRSMLPTIWPGDILVIQRAGSDGVFEGDIAVFSNGRRFVAHRVVAKEEGAGGSMVQTRGDAVRYADSPVAGDDLLGRVSFILRNGRCIVPRRSLG